ncbi:MAG: metalloregulator ArsR/SmtB family transcription factor [Synergistaceae bacterium]|nr:metalloregulator ArsR/SmtB family transcription factor [Synergistaceae bacterium]
MQEEVALFKALSDPTRLRLAVLLAVHGETCVCDLAAALDEPDYKISRHLGILRSGGLVEARREGSWMYYRLAENRIALAKDLHACLCDSLNEHPTVREDLGRLKKRCEKGARCDCC